MKFIAVNGRTYVRHWFRWYRLIDNSFYPMDIPPRTLDRK